MQLTDMAAERFDIGRCAILHYDDGESTVWDGTAPLFENMVHIGTTEGPVDINPNAEYSNLTIEVTGPAILKRYLSGENPSFELGVFPTPDNMALFSPTGRASAGTKRRRIVKSHTLWIVAEELFLKEDENGNVVEVPVTYSGGVFLKDGEAITADDQALIDMSIIGWKADFGHATPKFDHADGGKSLKSVPVTLQQDFTKPDGCQLYLVMHELDQFETLDFESVAS